MVQSETTNLVFKRSLVNVNYKFQSMMMLDQR